MHRKSFADKVLSIIAASILETGSFVYSHSHKGFGGRDFAKYQGSLSKAIFDLKEHGYLEEIEIKGEKQLKILPKGRLKLIKKKLFKQWDGWWRIIAFDIEEERKKTRNAFRNKLVLIGCLPIQKSVWITPCDISAELEEMVDLLNIKENVDYFLAKAMTNNDKYLKTFNLTE